jgi:AcrR family transcriptional regulator
LQENIFINPFSIGVKDRIIDISLQLFLKHGIQKITLQKLAVSLGISTKTFYKYFAYKEDILKHCLIRHYSALSNSMASFHAKTTNPLETLVKIWHQAIELDFGVNHLFYHDLNYYYPQLQDLVLQKFYRKHILFMHQLTSSCVRKGYLRKDIVIALVPEVIGTLYTSITRTSQYKQYKLSPKIIMQNTIDIYIRGLCTDAGLKELNKLI